MPRNIETLSISHDFNNSLKHLCYASLELDTSDIKRKDAKNYQEALKILRTTIIRGEMGHLTQKAIAYAFEDYYGVKLPTGKVIERQIPKNLLKKMREAYELIRDAFKIFKSRKRKEASDLIDAIANRLCQVREEYKNINGVNVIALGID